MTVYIRPDHSNPGEATRVAALLIAAADNPADVKTDTTQGSGLVFVVPDELAEKINLNPAETEESKDEAPKDARKKRKAQ